MNSVTIKCIAQKGASLPEYKTQGAAGADICACIAQTIELAPGQRYSVPTGLCFEIPEGYEIQVRPRSGLAIKHGIACVNAPGTIDSDYRGEVCVILINLGKESFIIENGDRIAQIIVAPVTKGIFEQVSQLSLTNRGSDGFGSTGKN